MKRILISLSIIGVVAAVATGVTIALFSDTETSAGNIFVAGTMDLKVDHLFASYNGSPCTKNCVEDTNTNFIQNGSFEFPEVTNAAKWQIFQTGTADLVWTVEWESTQTTYVYKGVTYNRPTASLVEYHEGVNGWLSQEGNQYAELDSDWFGPSSSVSGEPALVKIWQNVPTTAGTQYDLRYYFSARPNNGGGGNGTADNVLKVRINGVEANSHTLSNNTSQTQWNAYLTTFTATGATTKVEFAANGTANSLGVFLDNVRLYPMVCTYQIVGGTCTLWPLKDLGVGDYYWNFGPDMKPGDWGKNIISLHAYDNDAYACLITHNIVDAEDTVVDPEIEAGDTIDSVVGELSQFITVFAWEDTTQNNEYDEGEPIITPADTPLTEAIGVISLAKSITKFIGVEWCFGSQEWSPEGEVVCNGATVTDIAQTDIMNAYITAYAEQQRNNAGFVCPDLDQQQP